MKEVCILNQGDSIDKIRYEYNECNLGEICKIMGFNAVELSSGRDDIIIVKNYFPYFVYKINQDESILDILARGFDCGGVVDARPNDTIVISKPRSIRYTVKPLENIYEISNKVGVSVEQIKVSNNLISDKLFVGQILWI